MRCRIPFTLHKIYNRIYMNYNEIRLPPELLPQRQPDSFWRIHYSVYEPRTDALTVLSYFSSTTSVGFFTAGNGRNTTSAKPLPEDSSLMSL